MWSGWNAHGTLELHHEVLEPASDASAFRVGYADTFAQARLTGAVDAVMAAGVASIRSRILDHTAHLIEIADEAGIEVVSPRNDAERAGIVTLEPHPEFVGALAAALHNHGVSATVRSGRVRLSAHVSTDDETFAMLRSALAEFTRLAHV